MLKFNHFLVFFCFNFSYHKNYGRENILRGLASRGPPSGWDFCEILKTFHAFRAVRKLEIKNLTRKNGATARAKFLERKFVKFCRGRWLTQGQPWWLTRIHIESVFFQPKGLRHNL
jgi:hypothetical protein